MTVKELIEKLNNMDPDAEVLVEENHGDFYPVSDDHIYEHNVTEDYYTAHEEDNGKKAVVISV